MADYIELFNLASDGDLKQRVATALVIAAEAKLKNGAATANEHNWAAAVIQQPMSKAREAINPVLAANKGLTVANIKGASDAAIQINIDAIVDALVVAHNV